MNIVASQELRHAKGVLERRKNMVASLDKAETQKQAIQNHQEICGAVREVSRHRHNIMERIDNKTAGHAIEVDDALHTAKSWLEMSRTVLTTWGLSDSEIMRIEGALLEWL